MTEPVLWLVYAQNGMHGTRRMIDSGLTEEAAIALRDNFRNNKHNPEHYHKADYFVVPYEEGKRNETMAIHKIDF